MVRPLEYWIMSIIFKSLKIFSASILLVGLVWVKKIPAQFSQFQGGKLYLNLEGNMSPFALSSNTGARGAMSNITSIYPSATSLFGNPAALAKIQGMSVQSDFFLPGLGLGVSSERTKILRNNMRVPIQDFLSSGDNHVDNPVYPDVNLGLYQSTNVGGFSVAFGGPSLTLAAGVQQPLMGKFDFGIGGLRLGLGLPEEAGNPESDSIRVLISGDAFARFTAELNDFSLGIAGMPWENVRLGFAYQRYTMDMDLQAGARVDGILQRAGQESFFHGTGINYHDDLDAHGLGKVKGYAHGVRLGSNWQFSKHFGLDLMVSMVETMRLNGSLAWDYNVLPALDFSSSQILNPKNFNPTKLTLTTRSKSVIQKMELNLPWETGVSLHSNWNNLKLNFDYSYYLRGLSVRYTTIDSVDAFDSTSKDLFKDQYGKDSVTVTKGDGRFRLGLEQQFAFGIQVYQVFFQLGGVIYTIENGNILEEASAYRPESLPFLPTMNMGYYFPIGPHFTTTVSLVAFPVSLFKTSVEYRY